MTVVRGLQSDPVADDNATAREFLAARRWPTTEQLDWNYSSLFHDHMTPIRIFICYKKLLAGDRPNEKAGILHFILGEDPSLAPWLDDSGLPAGIVWETEIYRRLLVSDVLLVLVGPGTSESQWVRREIALATALGISILPVGFDLSRAELDKQLKDLDIGHIQAKLTQNIRLNARDAMHVELIADLRAAAARTRESQKETLRELVGKHSPPVRKAQDAQRAASFVLPSRRNRVTLHLATGDLMRCRDIDVIVNSENDYMQMARFFESRTVSSMIRRRGASVREGRYEDTIQQELEWQLRERGRPVQVAEVFVTSSGAQTCDLVKVNRARYIFHVAAVQAVDAQGIVVPFKEPHQIEACVRSTLAKLVEVNASSGVVSPPGTEQRSRQELRASSGEIPCRSILLPLFGTGQGGASARDVVESMLAGLTGYFSDEGDSPQEVALTDIYLSAYREPDAEQALSVLRGALATR